MARERDELDIDDSLLSRIAALSGAEQRWLKTALHTIRTMPRPDESEEEQPPRRSERRAGRTPRRKPEVAAPALEDVIEGRTTLDEQLEEYPELSEELEGLGEIIDMLRDLGERRRRRGEEILREEILGQEPERRRPREEDGGEGDEDFGF